MRKSCAVHVVGPYLASNIGKVPLYPGDMRLFLGHEEDVWRQVSEDTFDSREQT